MFTIATAPAARGQREDVISSIDQMMTKGYPEDKPGAAILVAQGDKIILKKATGKLRCKQLKALPRNMCLELVPSRSNLLR